LPGKKTAVVTHARTAAALACALLVAAPRAPARAAEDVTLLDLVEIEIGYTTLAYQYYQPVSQQRLLDGARTGIMSYLISRGVADPVVGYMHAQSNGRGAVPAIEREVGKAIVRYGNRVVVRDLVYATIRGEVASLHDPYSVFFTKAEVKGFETAINGETFGGVGVLTEQDSNGIWHAEEVFPDGPAAKAGMLPGDVLLAVDGKYLKGLTGDAAGALLRGKIGTTLHLRVERDGAELPQPLAIVRAAVTPPEVSSRMLPNGVGYVLLRTFGATAGKEVRDAVAALEARGARALVFDLRGNGGGYESASVQVASVFVPRGPIVSNLANAGKRVVRRATGTALPALPMVVLVDHDSASGSELTAAALQDAGVAKLVGTRTFGKGVAQEMIPLPDGAAIKLTTSRYYTPSGRDIDRVGLTPDVQVDEPAGSIPGVPGRDPQLDRALDLLRGAV